MHTEYELVHLQSRNGNNHLRQVQHTPSYDLEIEPSDASLPFADRCGTTYNESTDGLIRDTVDLAELADTKRAPSTVESNKWNKRLHFWSSRQDDSRTKKRSHRWDLSGWRMGIFVGFCLSLLVLCFNFALLLIAAGTNAGRDFGLDNVANIMVDDERIVSRWNTVCHIVINILSTGLLSASNYTIQVLLAPTREELDKAHKSREWLEIGLLGLHNIRAIPRMRATLCFILAVSSLPLHLFYNASVFKISTDGSGDEGSSIQISLVFLGVVIASNVTKLAVMLMVLILDESDYIVTLGDAASSYLKRPETLTEGKSLIYKSRMLASFSDASSFETRERVWGSRPQRYFSSISRGQIWCTIVGGLCLVTTLIALSAKTKSSNTDIWRWGTSSSGALALGSSNTSKKGILWNAWLCNLPQLFLSLFYLNINAICTIIAGLREWDNMATDRKGLRVTNPQGSQRSTYFLQLPYRWSVPLMSASVGLHWTLSQTFFPVRSRHLVRFDDETGTSVWSDISASGVSFSSLAVFCAALFAVVAGVLYMLCRRWTPHLPPVENCSLMISAACHPAPDEIDPQLETVQWGVIAGYEYCSLSSKQVGPVLKDAVFV